MKKILLATSAIVCLVAAAPAGAADIPVKAPVYRPAPPACGQFGGFWLGINGGWVGYDYTWNDQNAWTAEEDVTLPREITARNNGGAIGIGGGYNWQSNCTVFGIEADYAWSGARAEKFHTDTGGFDNVTVSSKLQGFGTLRARTGIVVDNLLLYVTGGLAWGSFDRSWTLTSFGDVSETFSQRRTRWGGVVGVGTEWSWGSGWSIRSEFLYMRFAKDEVAFTSAFFDPGDTKSFTSLDSIWTSRIGLTYRFGGDVFGKRPVSARY
jgi:outer membrane immunogenic protein